jgi:type II secretory pathway component PulF
MTDRRRLSVVRRGGRIWKVLELLLLVTAGVLLCTCVAGMGLGLIVSGVVPFYVLGVLGLFYGWMVYSFLVYRYGRQDELLHLLATVTESQAPLAPALRAYVHDRPHGPWRRAWVAGLLFFVVPGYYWVWHKRRSFDRKVVRLAGLLEEGASLEEALRATPGVASRETVLAVAVGQPAGRLAQSLRGAAQGRLAAVLLEALPRLLYPLILLLFLSLIFGFWTIRLAPVMQRIFREFDMQLPWATEVLLGFRGDLPFYIGGLYLACMGLVALALLLYLSPTACWYCPGIGRLYRMNARSRVLRMLAVLFGAGQPAPEALGLLAGAGYFRGTAWRRLEAVRAAVEQGEPLADSLRRRGLLPRSMGPLVRAAERAHNLPWALAELGDQLARRLGRVGQRMSLALFPVAVFGVGLLFGFLVLGMFLPLIKLLEGLSR